MLINISSNQLWFSTNWQSRRTYGQVQQEFPQLLIKTYQTFKPQQILVINGPWSFTNLRLGALTINLLKRLNPQLQIYQLSKIDFLSQLKKRLNLPDKGAIFIGQRKKARLWDFKNNTQDWLEYEQIPFLSQPLFFDQTFEFNPLIPPSQMINFQYFDKGKVFGDFEGSYFETDIQDFDWQLVDFLTPNYMLQPNISKSSPKK